jgi:hypothetical protein
MGHKRIIGNRQQAFNSPLSPQIISSTSNQPSNAGSLEQQAPLLDIDAQHIEPFPLGNFLLEQPVGSESPIINSSFITAPIDSLQGDWGYNMDHQLVQHQEGEEFVLGISRPFFSRWEWHCQGEGQLCNSTFDDIESLQTHFEQHYAFTRINPAERFKCPICHYTSEIPTATCMTMHCPGFPEACIIARYLGPSSNVLNPPEDDDPDRLVLDYDLVDSSSIDAFRTGEDYGLELKPSKCLLQTEVTDNMGISASKKQRMATEKLGEVLKQGGFDEVWKLLENHFETAAIEDFSWLHELKEAGYNSKEMAELLYDKTNNSPWIFSERQPMSEYNEIDCDYHLPRCAHQESKVHSHYSIITSSGQYDTGQTFIKSYLEQNALHYIVSELCGLAGIYPVSRDRQTWNGHVSFTDNDSVSNITYQLLTTTNESSSSLEVLKRATKCLKNFCCAVTKMQKAGICCDSFTVLQRVENSGKLCIEMSRIYFEPATKLLGILQDIQDAPIIPSLLLRCREASIPILNTFRQTTTLFGLNTGRAIVQQDVNEIVHICSLAVQFLSLGFMSYLQAHVGAVRPFFLDTAQRTIVLDGSRQVGVTGNHIRITAELQSLTCMGEMLQDSVMVFVMSNSEPFSQMAIAKDSPLKLDVIATPEDLMDTWGPGHFYIDSTINSSENIYAMSLGGGII